MIIVAHSFPEKIFKIIFKMSNDSGAVTDKTGKMPCIVRIETDGREIRCFPAAGMGCHDLGKIHLRLVQRLVIVLKMQ